MPDGAFWFSWLNMWQAVPFRNAAIGANWGFMFRAATLHAVVLSLILALSSISLSAMGQGAGGAMLVELCGSDTPVLVESPALPQDGPHAHCPECLGPVGAALLPKAARFAPEVAVFAAVYPALAAFLAQPAPALSPLARGPPNLI